jgi:hypothetical protein
MAGRLLVDVCPPCYRSLDDILRSVVSIWNASVEQLPYYLREMFGSETVVKVADRLAVEYPKGSRESRALDTIKWWLRAKDES